MSVVDGHSNLNHTDALHLAQTANQYTYLRCWRCDYDDTEQCVKNFDFTKHKHEACDGKCLKAFEKTEARTKIEIEKAQSKLILFIHIFIYHI